MIHLESEWQTVRLQVQSKLGETILLVSWTLINTLNPQKLSLAITELTGQVTVDELKRLKH